MALCLCLPVVSGKVCGWKHVFGSIYRGRFLVRDPSFLLRRFLSADA